MSSLTSSLRPGPRSLRSSFPLAVLILLSVPPPWAPTPPTREAIEILSRDPTHPGGHHALGRLHSGVIRLNPEALDELDALLALPDRSPHDPEIRAMATRLRDQVQRRSAR